MQRPPAAASCAHGYLLILQLLAFGSDSAELLDDRYAMFHLGKMDVLPVGDLGVRNGMKQLYGLKVRSSQAQAQAKPAQRASTGAVGGACCVCTCPCSTQ